MTSDVTTVVQARRDTGADALADLVCFDLYAASRRLTAAYRPILGPLGLTYPQYLVLVVLWSHGPSPIKALAASLRLDHGTLTPLLQRMEGAGLVTRSRSTYDERTVVVRPTEEGWALQTHVDDVQCRITEAIGLDREQIELLQRLLRSVSPGTGLQG